MWQTANCRGRRGRFMPAQCGLGVLLMLCVARAVVADYYQAMPMQRGSQPSNGETSLLVDEHPSYSGHGRKSSRGHRHHRQRSKHSLGSPVDPNPFDKSPLKDKTVSDSDNPFNHKPSDCGIYQHPHHAKNKTHVETLEEVDHLLCQYYGPWSSWRRCNRRCQQRRVRKCRVPEQCGVTKLKEHRSCRRKRGRCSSLTSQAVGDFRRQNQQIERVLYDALYTGWSSWSSCTRSCKQRRRRRCTVREVCQSNFIQESRRCSVPGSRCERRSKPGSSETGYVTTTAGTQPPDMSASAEEGNIQRKGSKAKPRPHRKNRKYGRKRDKAERGEGRLEAGDNVLTAVQKTCGRRPPAKRGSYRVVGGQEAQRLSWPWQMAIMTRWEEQYCAGTLIAPHWLLTAAHCVRKRGRRRRIVVRAGEHDLGEFEGSEQDIKPEREYPHPEFDYATIINDIALVRLRTPLEDRTLSGYACLPDPDFTPDRGSLCYIVGWGKRRNTHLFGAEVLHEAQVPLVAPKRCQKVFDYHINATQLCAGYRQGGTDACGGDSGGPLLCPKTEAGVTRWFLVGITSYGEGCGRRGKYGIYTRVTSYVDWITDTILSY